ncbi:hypothetical protein BGZ98_008380 [Dissophora globulifera]|nr:hypothetical protein BGZ98_008380 [Dissophora globulifera]
MKYIDPMSQTISAPILLPGTQQAPTVPALDLTGAGGSRSAATHQLTGSSHYSPRHSMSHSSSGGSPRGSSEAISRLATTLTLGPSNQNNSSNRQSLAGSTAMTMAVTANNNGDNAFNPNSGLRRFPTLGNLKKLTNENSTLRVKIAELERYLTGLKEELILTHRQIHTKTLDAKLAEERKRIEIHELAQHIQRCEEDLLVRTSECEALQSKLQYQTKEQMMKIKRIHMLEAEVSQYRRLSTVTATTTASAAILGGGRSSEGRRSSLDGHDLRVSRNATAACDSPAVYTAGASPTVKPMQKGESAIISGSRENRTLWPEVFTATTSSASRDAELTAQLLTIQRLRGKNAHKDQMLEEFSAVIDGLQAKISHLEFEHKQQREEFLTKIARLETDLSRPEFLQRQQSQRAVIRVASDQSSVHQQHQSRNETVSASSSDDSFNTAIVAGADNRSIVSSESGSVASRSTVNSVGYDYAIEHPKLLARYQALRAQHAQASEYVSSLESENQELKVQLLDISVNSSSSSSSSSGAMQSPAVVVIPSSSNYSLHHPAASTLAPLDIDALAVKNNNSALSSSASTATPSPTTTGTSSTNSPSTIVAPALTRKSSLRYSRDGQQFLGAVESS